MTVIDKKRRKGKMDYESLGRGGDIGLEGKGREDEVEDELEREEKIDSGRFRVHGEVGGKKSFASSIKSESGI